MPFSWRKGTYTIPKSGDLSDFELSPDLNV